MKKIFLPLVLLWSLVWLTACRNTPAQTPDPLPADAPTMTELPAQYDTTTFTTIEWLDPVEQNLGTLTPGKEVEISWRFRNSGQQPLLVESVTATCGCTIPEKPEAPIAPGKTGLIKARFNGSGSGTIVKQVQVTANTKPSRNHTLQFKGDVNDKK